MICTGSAGVAKCARHTSSLPPVHGAQQPTTLGRYSTHSLKINKRAVYASAQWQTGLFSWANKLNGSMQQQQQQAEPQNGSSKPGRINAKDVIYQFYDAYNAGDIDAVEKLLAEDVSYHDMALYPEPFEGRQEVADFLRKVRKIVPDDLRFVIEDATEGDSRKVGITWHVECGDGTAFPFSRGCSFYWLNKTGQIVKARDLVEPAVKPGSATLGVLAAVTPLVRKLGPRADPNNLNKLPVESALLWLFYAGYLAHIMLSSSAPGKPAFQTPPDQLMEVFTQSVNFFYVNIVAGWLGLPSIPLAATHPVGEAVFNFVVAWALMFLPVMLTEGKSAKVPNKVAWWLGNMFLTNLFFIPFLALRAAPEPDSYSQATGPASSSTLTPASRRKSRVPKSQPLPGWARGFGVTALAVGLVSIWWALAARPEFGGLDARWAYTVETFYGNRIFYAFAVDALLYSVWQAMLLADAPMQYRYVPFFGMAAYLIAGPGPATDDDNDGKEGKVQ